MARCCGCVAVGALLGVLIVVGSGAVLIQFTTVLENKVHH